MNTDTARLLRWYPSAWRDRYGDELLAMMDDELGGRRPSPSFTTSIRWAGLRERLFESGLVGGRSPAEKRFRTGSLLVLCGWAAYLFAGASFAKASEHFSQSMPIRLQAMPQDAYDLVVTLAVASAVFVALGAVIAFPSFLRFLHADGWAKIRGNVMRAVVGTGLTVVAVIPLGLWAHYLSDAQRNGSDAFYSAMILTWAGLFGMALALDTAAVVAIVRRLDLSSRELRMEGWLAAGTTVAMAGIASATAWWWVAMLNREPSFIEGSVIGHVGSPYNAQLIGTLSLMLAGFAVAAYGIVRMLGSRRGLREA